MRIAGNPLIWHLNVETEFTWESLRAKLLESCLTLCNPMDCNSSGCSVYGDSPGKNTGVGCHAQEGLPDTGIEPMSHVSCVSMQVLYHQRHLEKPLEEAGVE